MSFNYLFDTWEKSNQSVKMSLNYGQSRKNQGNRCGSREA